MLTISGLHHVGIRAFDMDGSRAFWCDVLGPATRARNRDPAHGRPLRVDLRDLQPRGGRKTKRIFRFQAARSLPVLPT